MQVGEGTYPEPVEHVLGGDGQPQVGDPLQQDADQDKAGRQAGEHHDDADVDIAGEHTLVEDHLDRERDEQFAGRNSERHRGRQEQSGAKFR